MKQGRDRALYRLRGIAALIVLLSAACQDDPFGPQFWNDQPVEMTLYSASRPATIGRGSALDLASEPVQTVAIEAPGATGNWDFALVDEGGGLALLPAGNLQGVVSRAGIAVIDNTSFVALEEAPRDTARYTTAAVPLQAGGVYVLRSRRAPCGFSNAFRYAKLQVLELDQVRGTFRFAIVRNPYCDDRSLVAPRT